MDRLEDIRPYLYGQLNKEVEWLEYKGKSTNTIDLIVDNENKVLSANLTPNIIAKQDAVEKELKEDVGKEVQLDVDENYVLAVRLVNGQGSIISQAQVDLPIEELIKDVKYDDSKKALVIQFENGQVVEVPVSGLVDGLVKSVDMHNQLYGTDSEGNQATYAKSEEAAADTIPVRDSKGNLKVGTAIEESDAASKKYVDEAIKDYTVELREDIDSKLTKTSEANKIYGTESRGYQYQYNISENADAYSIAQRTNMGRLKSQYPVDEDDVTTKASVDSGLSKKLNRVNKESDYLSVYAVTNEGGDAFLKQRSDKALAWSVPLRFRQGQILAARADIETNPDNLKDSEGNPVNVEDFVVTYGQLKETESKIDNKLNKTNTNYVLYGTTSTGEDGKARQSELPFRSTATNNSIAQRTSDGRLKVNAPTEADDSVNLQYLNENVLINQNDSTNAYYPKGNNNSINGKNDIVGSKGFNINETNFHEGSFGYLLFRVLEFPEQDTYFSATKVRCYQYNDVQEFTIVDRARTGVKQSSDTLMFVVNEMPYIYSEDVDGFTKIEFCDDSGILATFTSTQLKTLWYGCVCEHIHVIPREFTRSAENWVEQDETGEYKVKEEYKKAMYYIDMPETPNIVNEPACIKINNNYDSGTRQYYIDRGFKEDLSDADDCLVAQGLNIDYNSYLVLTLGAFHGHKGWGLVGKPTFGAASHVRFPDHPETGDVFVGNGFDNALGYSAKATFDYGFSTGYNNNSLGRYSITGGTRNIAAYASVAFGNHNSVISQSSFAAGAANVLTDGASCSAALGQENTIKGKACLVGGRGNKVEGKYSTTAGFQNKLKKDSSTAFGYTNILNGEGEFAAGIGHILNGRGAACLGAVNQSLGNYSLVGGYTNKTTSDYNFLTGLNNTVEWANSSTALGNKNNIKIGENLANWDGVGHFVVGSNNTIVGGRNVILGGQSSSVQLRDSIVVGNNLVDESNSYGKAIFGNYNAQSGASIVLGAGDSKDNRKNAFEVYSNGKVFTNNAVEYADSDAYRLTTKQYVDNKVAGALILTSPNGTKYKLIVDDSGNLSTEKVN